MRLSRAEKPLTGSAGVEVVKILFKNAVNIVDYASYGAVKGFKMYAAVFDVKSRRPRAAPVRSEAMEADFNDAIEAIESLTEDVATTINTASQRWNQRFYFYFIMRSVEPSLSKEVDKAAESAHAEMGGGKDLAEDRNYVVVIAGIGLVEVSGHSSSE